MGGGGATRGVQVTRLLVIGLMAALGPNVLAAQELVNRCFAPEVRQWSWVDTDREPKPRRAPPESLPGATPEVFRLLDEPGLNFFGDTIPESGNRNRLEPVRVQEGKGFPYQMSLWYLEDDELHLTLSTGVEWVGGTFSWADTADAWKGHLQPGSDEVGPGTWRAAVWLHPVECPE